ncbi:MAG TPA: MOSC N-terminal beta barrel domain-containing protein [Gemmatimonadales bacterium]|nr:MOSC N-terminal beta barrel domain-containing protein [Gemmatimonadales bacterium]
MTLRLSALTIYPIKAARGIALDQSEIDGFGLRYDRRWMVTDRSGEFLSQRSHPQLALVTPSIQGASLHLDAPGRPRLELPLHPSETVTTSVTVWGDTCPATWLGESAARWFSEFLQTDCNLVHMGDRHVRRADPTLAPGARVSFADASPFLLISEASLADLNGRLAEPLPMNRFRPNLVVAGGEPYAEDAWMRIEIGRIRLRMVKPCGRCVVTTTDQSTGERGQEPLRTLATYRRRDGEVMFGQNAVHENTGCLGLGDEVQIL